MKLLSTRQAAKSLGVSEASVRRWSDQGLLPVQRIGPRRVRRFDPGHLEGAPRNGRAGQPAPRRGPGQVLLGGTPVDVPVHLAAFYDSDEGRVRLTAPFLADGILARQPCFLLAQGEELQAYMEALDRIPGVEVDSALSRGDLTIVGAPGRTVAQALDFWEKHLWSAMERHVSLVRAVGEMVSEREHFESEREMLAYEATFNLTARRFPCAVICQYDVRKFSGPTILAALRAHPDILDVSLSLLLK